MPRPLKIKGYGWKRSLPDHRHPKFANYNDIMAAANLPPLVDLRLKCPPVYDQIQLGSCHDAMTEVLTRDGWKFFPDLIEGDKLATVNPETNEFIFEKPSRLIAFHYKGDMYKGRQRNLDFYVTPDHNMLVRPWDENKRTLTDNYKLVPMKDVGWYAGLMNRVDYKGESNTDTCVIKGVNHKRKSQREDITVNLDDWLQFLGIYLAEGTVLRSTKEKITHQKDEGGLLVAVKSRQKIYKVQIAASKEREKIFVRGVFDRLGINYLESKDRFTFSNKRIYSALEALGLSGVKSYNKFVPEFIFKLGANHIKKFLEGHFHGDGCQDKNNLSKSHYTSSKRLADDLQTLTFLSGNESYIGMRPPRLSQIKNGRIIRGRYPEYRVSVCENKNLSIYRKHHITVDKYDGMVYCAEMPSYHTMVTRRNNRILISGNCTANASAGLVQYKLLDEGKHSFVPSRLFIYYNERVIEGTVNEDSGATLTDGIKVIVHDGAPPESLWWYNDDGKTFKVKPNKSVYQAALKTKAYGEQVLDNTNLPELKTCLAGGSPFIFGFTVYESFESDQVAKTGVVPMPGKHEELLGGHAVMAVGYDDSKKVFIVRNSWGADWGLKGYFLFPYDYVTNTDLSADYWTIQKVVTTN